MAAQSPSHRWSFYRAGGVDQVRIETGADVLNLDKLDQKLWVALSCPVKGLEFDERTLALLDVDNDAHVRPPEILAAVKWLGQVIRNPDELVPGKDGVPLANIRDDTAEGKQVLASAQLILRSLGKENEGTITVADTARTGEIFTKARLNGDGVVPPASIEDAATRKVAEDILACLGGVADRSGALGVDQARIDRFFADCIAFRDWYAKGEAHGKKVMPLGDGTAAAAAAVAAVRTKVDDYFGRCQLAGYDPRAQAALNREETAYLEVAAQDLTIHAAEVAHFPLALVEAKKPLPLGDGVNPAWREAVQRLRELCVAPLLGKDRTSLTEADWTTLCGKLAAFQAWQADKQGASVEALGIARIREILAGKAQAALTKAVSEDAAVAKDVEAIELVEKLVRFYRDIHTLLNNFVSFTDFYSRKKAVFQAGTLYLDGRACDLCVHVNDAGKHGSLAAMARTYLAYVDCTRPSGEKMTVACAFTAGDSDNLFVGRNGVFYDRKGRDWNATITKIIASPISIRQAFWSPYKKLLRWIEEQVAKRAAAADDAATAKLQTAAIAAGDSAETGKAPKPKFDVGVVAALGVAVGGLTAALAGVFAAMAGMEAWKLPLILVGVILVISGPSMLIAWLKLRQRNLGPILDANGWAVNTLTKVNIPLGSSLTGTAVLPPGAQRSLTDPYAPKKSSWPRVFFAVLVLAAIGFGLWKTGYLHQWWPDCPLPEPEAKAPANPAPADKPADAPADKR